MDRLLSQRLGTFAFTACLPDSIAVQYLACDRPKFSQDPTDNARAGLGASELAGNYEEPVRH